jgi:phage gpG-like protein
MIKMDLIGGDAVVAYLGNIYPRVLDATKKSITASLLELSRYVKEGKLSGQVLRNQTGRLRRSIHASDVVDRGGTVEGTVGTNVEYAAPHEYGFNGVVTVKAHMRMITKAWGKSIKDPHQVSIRSHGRHVNLPERSFLRSSLRELAPQFVARLQQDVNKAMEK